MDAQFNFTRLVHLIRRQWYENSRLYLYSTLALLGLMIVVFWLWIVSSGTYLQEDAPYLIFMTGFYITGSIFASVSFNALSDKTRATYFLGTPASHLEKLLCTIFYSTIVFVIVYVLCFLLAKTLAYMYIDRLLTLYPDTYRFNRVDMAGDFGFVMKICLFGFFAVQSLYLLGSIYFARYSFVVTTLVGAAIILLFVIYCASLFDAFFDKNYGWNGKDLVVYDQNTTSYRGYELSPGVMGLLWFLAKFMWAPVFWTVAWFRLKEKQV